jgi:single-stranded-DNA-specific exonuclease
VIAEANIRRAKTRDWRVRSFDRQRAFELARELAVSEIVARILTARGIDGTERAHQLLNPSPQHFHDPCLLRGLDAAAARIFRAIDASERILIYGDYDVDGTMGTVLLRRALKLLGAQTCFHIPHRFTEGYGINREALERAKLDGCTLVISVDCGIRAHEPLQWARENNLDVIVTDHHPPDEAAGAPPALAVINPNQKDCAYPDKNLAGVGVAWKLADALLRARGRGDLTRHFLKIVALGTVADVAPLTGENRAIVALGLRDLPKAKNAGLRALMRVAGFEPHAALNVFDLGFKIAPRINAAGRMDAARVVVELFEAEDEAAAAALAAQLDAHNRERQQTQNDLIVHALREFDRDAHSAVVVVADFNWHRGVLGLAASRLAEKLNRPCIVISLDADGTGHGSARSCGDYHLLDALTTCKDLFEQFGGHAHAAGLRIRQENTSELRRRLDEHATEFLRLSGRELVDGFAPALEIDAELPIASISMELAEELKRLEPFGAGWARPVFAACARVIDEPRLLKEKHLKMRVIDAYAGGAVFDALHWNWTEKNATTPRAGDCIELAYSIETNTWRNETRVQLIVQDMKGK